MSSSTRKQMLLYINQKIGRIELNSIFHIESLERLETVDNLDFEVFMSFATPLRMPTTPRRYFCSLQEVRFERMAECKVEPSMNIHEGARLLRSKVKRVIHKLNVHSFSHTSQIRIERRDRPWIAHWMFLIISSNGHRTWSVPYIGTAYNLYSAGLGKSKQVSHLLLSIMAN